MSPEKSEFERCIEANILLEIFRDSPNLTILPDTDTLNLEFRIPIKMLEEFLELGGSAHNPGMKVSIFSKIWSKSCFQI